MLQALKKYAESRKLVVAPGFSPKDIRWAVDCALDGRFLAVIPLGDGKKAEVFPVCPFMTDSQLKTGGEIRSQVFWESAKVALDWDDKGERKERDAVKHDFFLKMLESAGESVPQFEISAKALRSENKKAEMIRALKDAKAKPTDKVTFSVSGEIPLRGEAWHGWWSKWFEDHCASGSRDPAGEGGMVCLMSGDLVQPAMTHDKVTKLPDTGSFGGALAAFDKDAFTSFGLKQGQNAAMSADMASLYPKALDHLLVNASRVWGPVRAVVWFKKAIPEADATLAWLYEGNGDAQAEAAEASLRVRRFLDSIRQGQSSDLGANEYYCLMVSGSASRVVIRSWTTGRLKGLAGSIESWFSDLRIARRDGGGEAQDPKFFAVVGSALDKDSDPLAGNIIQFWNCATLGYPIPRELMVKALKRFDSLVRRNETVLHAGVGLLKAFHIRKGDRQMQVHLNAEHPAAEYQCGRLLAVLSALQYSALGDVGAGVVQRFYGAASQSPRTVIGSLVRNSQHHLSKLDGGLRYWYQEKISEIMARFKGEFPKTLTLEQQSLFALGYYQQMAQDRSGRGRKNQEQDTQTEEART